MRRVICQNWIVDLGHDPSLRWNEIGRAADGYNQTIISAVNHAMMALNEDELDFVRSYFIQGISYRELSKNTGKSICRIELLHRRVLKKLKKCLQQTLAGMFNVPPAKFRNCPLCNHPQKRSINTLIRTKKAGETWQRIIGALYKRFGIVLSTVQILQGHHKYHMRQEE